LLELARVQQRILSSPSNLLPIDYIEFVMRRGGATGEVDPMLIDRLHRDAVKLEALLKELCADKSGLDEALELAMRIHLATHDLQGRRRRRGYQGVDPTVKDDRVP
jgi:hypothetical protein